MRPKDGAPRAREEARLDEQRHHVALGDRLAVEPLDRQALEPRPARVVDQGDERNPEPPFLGIAEGDERAAAALDEEGGLAVEKDDVRAGHSRRAGAGALRPGQGRAVRLRRIGGREDEGRSFRRLLAEALDGAGKGELRPAEPFDEVPPAADPEGLELAQLAVDGRVTARDALGSDPVPRDDPLALEQELGERPRVRLAREQAGGRRPPPLRGRDRIRPPAREAPRRPLSPGRRVSARRAQRLPGVVRDLARPDEIPERREGGLRLEPALAKEVEPEERACTERRPERLVLVSLRRRERGGPPETRRVLAEVDRHPLETRSDPDDLARGGQLVERRRLVAGDAAREEVGLPEPHGEREALERDERLAQPRPPANALPGGQEPAQRALVDRLDLLAKPRETRAPQPAQDVGVAPLALGASGAQLPAREVEARQSLLRLDRVEPEPRRRLVGREGPPAAGPAGA